ERASLHSITSSGAREQRRRNFQVKRPGRLEIDDELDFGRLHDRQIGGLGALEDASDIVAHLTPHIGKISSITHQPAGLGKLARRIDRRNAMAGSEGGGVKAAGEEKGCGGGDGSGGGRLWSGGGGRVFSRAL